ncbi:MAG TPA: hypothetical protein VFK13_14635 [Gemmatimonadaceae bacterium]|nr:hypothetical protein [Gemmatimonadaceae bacterium]
MAQVSQPGGCDHLARVDAFDVRFFRDVHFQRAICSLEHGDTATALVGRDDRGTVYLLDSPSAFRFLVRQHPPVGIDSSTAVEYAYVALEMQGAIYGTARLIHNTGEISPSALSALDTARLPHPLTGVVLVQHSARIGDLMAVIVTVSSSTRVASFIGYVHPRGSFIFATEFPRPAASAPSHE